MLFVDWHRLISPASPVKGGLTCFFLDNGLHFLDNHSVIMMQERERKRASASAISGNPTREVRASAAHRSYGDDAEAIVLDLDQI